VRLPDSIGWHVRRRRAADRARGDFGYALHATLAQLFGDIAPKPFLFAGRHAPPRDPGYTSADPTDFVNFRGSTHR